MKFRTIGTKMLVTLLTVSLLSMILLSIVSYTSSKAIIDNQIQQNMNAELEAQINNILLKTEKISTIASQIARNVESNYTTTKLTQYEDMLGKVIFESNLAFGGGIWFEPYVYDKQEKYVGPYAYKDKDAPVVTYDYSNEEYDYLSYDWYKNAIDSKEPVFSELYYDSTLDTTMATCAVPMYDRSEKFLGVITIDMEISSIQDMINKVTIGKKGKITLLTDDGLYISNEDPSKIMTANIKEEENKSLASMGQVMLQKDNGTGEFDMKGIVYKTYYSRVGNLGWRIMIQMPESEMNQPLDTLLFKLITICTAGLLLLFAVIILLVRGVIKNIKVVNRFALSLADGDFSVQGVNIKTKDEFGQMGQALNQMLQNNKAVIQTMKDNSQDIRKTSIQLDEIMKKLSNNFNQIDSAIQNINEDIISSSAATEEVNASVEEVNAFINILSQETVISHNKAYAIKGRA
ncbi:methyl-accepting chemotaxis protein [Anaerocolumna sp. MB42-C2]|uniref:methyl-accepting chemotaxis protein n=1 Tax=Anaerocolumna sp. MB42-C2 TaxID=3070997 RepID=UPI0027DF1F32|nr:methyl-accepting chemotaxis protein [Anaerocolumna sp. MB42-C2]WMJ90108.1 methyl-accepting chemotaxis protein [Anaerocolumna sp. MB42-C2]